MFSTFFRLFFASEQTIVGAMYEVVIVAILMVANVIDHLDKMACALCTNVSMISSPVGIKKLTFNLLVSFPPVES